MSKLQRYSKKCDEMKKNLTCDEIFKYFPPTTNAPEPRNLEIKQSETSEHSLNHKRDSIKKEFLKFVKPKPKKEPIEAQKNVFKYCSLDPPCHLECLYGKRIDKREEEPEDMVKSLVYTKCGTPYETIAYRLPDDFATELKHDAEAAKPPTEEEYLEEIRKKKKKKLEIMEFTGPVRIILVDKDGFFTSYTGKRIQAAFIPIGYILIGATIMCIYYYTLKFKYHYSTNVHIICCAIAFQYCVPSAILVRNKFSISGYHLSKEQQTRESVLLKLLAIINIFVGVGLIARWKDVLPMSIYTRHSIPGFAACGFTIAEFCITVMMWKLIGPDRGRIIECYLHFLNVATIFTSYYSFVTGVLAHPGLKNFMPYKDWYYWIFAFAAIFALTAIFKPCIDCLFYIWTCIYRAVVAIFQFFRPHTPCTPRGEADIGDNPY